MKTENLQEEFSKYLDGHSMQVEVDKVQRWLSIVDKSELHLTELEKATVATEILNEIKAYTHYPELFAKAKPWWQRV